MFDRRSRARGTATLARRRYPRIHLDYDWFLEIGDGRFTTLFGRGLEVSPRGARLAVVAVQPVPAPASLYVALPHRARMFKASGVVSPSKSSKGLIILFQEITDADLVHLGLALVDAAGIKAIPSLKRRFARYDGLPARVLRDSTRT